MQTSPLLLGKWKNAGGDRKSINNKGDVINTNETGFPTDYDLKFTALNIFLELYVY